MESVEPPTMLVTDTKTICSTLQCTRDGGDEISKKLEDELLYGTTEDADEDDGQSDDSLRLRLSDDDIDADEDGASLPVNNQLEQPEKTELFDMDFDVDTSNDCSMQLEGYSNGMNSIASKHNGFKKELDFTDDLPLMEYNSWDLGEANSLECRSNQFLILNTVKYTYENQRNVIGSFKTYFNQANSDHSYYSSQSNHYCNKYYNQNSHYGQCRGHKFGEFNTYFNSLGLGRKYSPRVYPPNRKVISETKHCSTGSNSQKNVSATENTSHTDNSSTGINNIQQKIDNDIKSITTDNDSSVVIEPKLATDRSNTSINPSDKTSELHNVQNEVKENGIVEQNNEIISTESDIIESNSSKGTNEKLEAEFDSEKLNVPISTETKHDDIQENSIITNVNCSQSSPSNCTIQEIKEVQLPSSEVVLITSTDKLPKNETITNKQGPISNIQNHVTITENERIIVDRNNVDNKSQKLCDSKTTIDSTKQDHSNSENHIILNYDDVDRKGIKPNIECSEYIADDENKSCKTLPEQKSMIDEPNSINNTEMEEDSVIEVPLTTEKCLKAKQIAHKKNNTCKLENGIEKLNNVNLKSELLEMKTSVVSIDLLDDDENLDKDDDKLEITAVIQPTEISGKGKRRRKKRRINSSSDVVNTGQEKENVRQKRETAQKAEEMIRKRFLNQDSDTESSDNDPSFVNYNKPNPRAQPASPPSLKRNCPNETNEINVKKPKIDSNNTPLETIKSSNNHKTLEQVRKFFWRNEKKSLSKFTQEELEELLIQKVIETITMRDEIGKLREQAKISERNQEATRLKCQQLTKQIKDFEMVLCRFSADRRTGDKNVPPIKINRSVGLQVNFLTQDHGVQNLRQLQQNAKSNAVITNGGNSSTKQQIESSNNNSNVRKGIKVRSPRRSSDMPPISPTVSTATTQIDTPATPTTVTPEALVVPNSTDNNPVISSPSQQVTQKATVIVNGAITTTPRQPNVLSTRSNNNNNNNNNLIDLTGEEEKTKCIADVPPLTAITTVSNSATVPKTPPRYQRVIQSAPSNITIPQSAIKLVQPGDKPMPTAIVNNMNASRLAFVMHGIAGQRRLLIPSNTTPIRPATTVNNRPSLPITYTGVQAIPKGSVRVMPVTASATTQKYKHPAPLPGVTTYPVNATLKLPPPAPALKISKVANGIVLSWNMKISNEYAEIASYQLYAYQEMAGLAPSTSLWKKVGDVRALPLPMACTLTQFSEGNNYYFAVRAVDTHSRFGQYSQPGNISL